MREAGPPVQNAHLDILNKTKGCGIMLEGGLPFSAAVRDPIRLPNAEPKAA
jgi:hypothetical protein